MHHATQAFENSHRDSREPAPGSRWARLAFAFLRTHVVVICISAGLLLAYALAGFFLVPHLARSQLDAFVGDTLQQRLAIGEIRFNPFTFEASAREVRMSDPQGRDLVGFRHLYVNAELASLWQRAVVLKEVDLAAPAIKLIVEPDGTVNLRALRPPATADTKQDEASLPIRIGRFALREGQLGIEDHTRQRPFFATLAPIRFTLVDFKTDAGHRNGYHFAGTTSSGERLEWQGAFTVQPLGSMGEFTIGALRLRTLESYLEESLPFRVASGEADLSGQYRFALEPLALDVTLPGIAVRNLSLARRDAADAVPVQAADVKLDALAFSLEQRNVRVRAIDVTDARIDVAREPDGTIDLSRLFTSSADTEASSPAEPAASEATPAWHAAIDTVRIANATLHAEDRTVEPAVRLEVSALESTIAGWHTGPDAAVQLTLAAVLNSSGKLEAAGTLNPASSSGATTFALTGFELSALQPYVGQAAAMTLHSGALDAKGKLELDASNAEALQAQFTGDVHVANFRTTDHALNQDFIKWRRLAIEGIAYKHAPASLAITRIAASQPYANVIIAEDGTLNVSRVLNATREQESTAPADENPQPAAASKPMAMSVRTVQVDNGSADFADRSIEPSFAARIVDLQGKVTGLSSRPASRAKVALTGKVDEYAPVDINGDVNILAATKYSDLAMSFRNMELTTFNPYSGKFAGYNISKGKLSTELRYRIEDRRLQADHHIIVDNLEFGEKTDSKDAAPIPIKLGVALLKDRNGVIDINLPVSGTLDDPQFRLGPIIWKAVLGLLTKVVTAPFAALGALFGGGDELAYVDFEPGAAALNAAAKDKLDKLSKALAERPALRLDVPVTGLTAADAEAIAKQALATRIPAELAAEPADEAAQRKRLGEDEKIYRSVVGRAPDYPEALQAKDVPAESKREWLESEMLQKLQPDAAALDALARERARAVQTALLANPDIQPERIFVTTDRVATVTPEGAVRMELKLE